MLDEKEIAQVTQGKEVNKLIDGLAAKALVIQKRQDERPWLEKGEEACSTTHAAGLAIMSWKGIYESPKDRKLRDVVARRMEELSGTKSPNQGG